MVNQFQLPVLSRIDVKYGVTAPYLPSFLWIQHNLQTNIVPNILLPLYKTNEFPQHYLGAEHVCSNSMAIILILERIRELNNGTEVPYTIFT
jgi:hypothetical protein